MKNKQLNAIARRWHAERRGSQLLAIDGGSKPTSATNWARLSAVFCLITGQMVYSASHADTLLIQNQYNISGVFDFKNIAPPIYAFDAPLPTRYYGEALTRKVTFDIVEFRTSGMPVRPAAGAGYVYGSLSLRTEPFRYMQSRFNIGSTSMYRVDGVGWKVVDSHANFSPTYGVPIDPIATKFSFATGIDAACGTNDVNVCLQNMAGSLEGQFFVKMTESVVYDLDRQSFSQKISRWLHNDAPLSISNIKRIIRKEVSEHTLELIRKGLFVPEIPKNGGPGIRGSVDFVGTTVFTASPGVLSYDITLSNTDDVLSVPLAFTRNNRGSFVDMFFNDELLLRVQGDDYSLDELQIFDLNVSALRGRQGTLSLVVNTSGSGSAEIFVPDSIAGNSIAFADPALPVPEPQTWAMTLLGLAGLGLWLRGRNQVGVSSKP